ncbi:predicted protein [Plenodomus lingam JN3]|uniref:Predicted protein n=2 Tax=Leptosphaeria maculans TaxID=5022 RepID=E4ZXJ0_LEPMJ|nr:predicted protein [Plenodomus lingam JN3]CBX95400.1 predicted protein [Plenodomus lingam JN3]
MRRRVLLMLKLIVRKDLAASMIQTAEVTNESAEILIAKDNSFESGPASLATSTLLSSWRSRMSTHYHGLPTEPRVFFCFTEVPKQCPHAWTRSLCGRYLPTVAQVGKFPRQVSEATHNTYPGPHQKRCSSDEHAREVCVYVFMHGIVAKSLRFILPGRDLEAGGRKYSAYENVH